MNSSVSSNDQSNLNARLLSTDDFELKIVTETQRIIAGKWLALGVCSLLGAGLFSLLLVMSRTPGVQSFIPWIDFFHTALVVHVDLSVLIWFLSMAACFWCLSRPESGGSLDLLCWRIAVLGTLILVICPFFGVGKPLMNNYVPVLQHPVFYLAIGLFCLAICIQALATCYRFIGVLNNTKPPLFSSIQLSAFPALLCFLVFALSWVLIPASYTGEYYFELLFWGAGHTLQFTHTLLLLLAWCILVSACGAKLSVSRKTFFALCLLVIAPVTLVPIIYGLNSIDSPYLRLHFTELMKYGGLASLPIGLLVLWTAFKLTKYSASQKPLKAALYASIILFAAGGIIGFMIEGANVVIPAHYHGSIVGVTLAFMGLAYLLLPKLGLGEVNSKMAAWQPYVYGGGQLMHILGLAWSGGYGVQRKTAGAAQGLERLPEIVGMGMMGLGGLISTIGGLMFLIVMIKTYRKRSAQVKN